MESGGKCGSEGTHLLSVAVRYILHYILYILLSVAVYDTWSTNCSTIPACTERTEVQPPLCKTGFHRRKFRRRWCPPSIGPPIKMQG